MNGQQSARWPDGTGTPGIVDYTRSMYTDYFPDGLESAARDLNGQRELFAYDQDGNQTLAIEAAGIEQASQSPIWIDRTYNDFDTLTKTRVPEPGVSGRYLATLYTYDSDGNQTSEAINQEEDANGTVTTPAQTITDSYDLTDVLTSQTDDQGTPGSTSDDTELDYTYTPDDELSSSTLLDASGTQDEETDYGYYADGELASQSSEGAQGQTLQTDSVSYLSPSGVYMNGNQVSENYSQHGPSQTVSGTASWGYNADGELTSENPGTAQDAASYALDATGDITSQQSASGTTTDTYANEQLTSQTTSGTTTRYLYDAFGNVNCAVTSSWTLGTCPAPGDTHLIELYTYDYKNRETSDVIYNSSGVVTDSAAYVYDALDRIVIKSEYHSGSWTTICTVYEGDSTTVASEKVYPYASPTGNPSDLKTYAYDGSGNIVSLTDQSGGNANRYSLVANPQNSVSLLLDASGNVKQSYGYSAYGQANGTLTQLGTLSSTLDPYRFQEKRLDPAFNSYDMGARRYSLTTDRWQQQDMYYDASQDLGLAGDPTTSDKYEFLGGNPVNYVEADGHKEVCKTNFAYFARMFYYDHIWDTDGPEKMAWIKFGRSCTWCWNQNTVTRIKVQDWIEPHNGFTAPDEFESFEVKYIILSGPNSTYTYPQTPWYVNGKKMGEGKDRISINGNLGKIVEIEHSGNVEERQITKMTTVTHEEDNFFHIDLVSKGTAGGKWAVGPSPITHYTG